LIAEANEIDAIHLSIAMENWDLKEFSSFASW
jgi:hypothetical protein